MPETEDTHFYNTIQNYTRHAVSNSYLSKPCKILTFPLHSVSSFLHLGKTAVFPSEILYFPDKKKYFKQLESEKKNLM